MAIAARIIMDVKPIVMGEYLDRFRLSFVDPDGEIIAWDYEKLNQEFSQESMITPIKWNQGDTPPPS